MTKKLCYILPEASQTTHMKYNVEFITALAKEAGVDIYLILERGKIPENFKEETGVKHLGYTGNSFMPLRVVKMLYFLIDSHLKGFSKVYVHYSFIGAFLASVLIPKREVYYWNCGLPWLYKRPFFQELYESSVYKLIDHFVTGAKVLTQQYADFYKFDNKKSIVIPNWIDLVKVEGLIKHTDKEKLLAELNIPERSNILFFNQRLATRKGAHYLPQILQALVESEKRVILIITNDGPYREELLKDLERVPNDKVIQLMSITDIYLLPSEEEGMSHSLMEAFAGGVASVAFNVGGTVDMYPIDFRKYVVHQKDILSFIDRVSLLLENPFEKKELSLSLQNKVKEYDKGIVLKEFVEKIFH